jgi:hypothetical protein
MAMRAKAEGRILCASSGLILRSEAVRRILHLFSRICFPMLETGVFKTEMKVEVHNDGPVTILLDSERNFLIQGMKNQTSSDSSIGHFCKTKVPYEQPVVAPQSRHTLQVPFLIIRVLEQVGQMLSYSLSPEGAGAALMTSFTEKLMISAAGAIRSALMIFDGVSLKSLPPADP